MKNWCKFCHKNIGFIVNFLFVDFVHYFFAKVIFLKQMNEFFGFLLTFNLNNGVFL